MAAGTNKHQTHSRATIISRSPHSHIYGNASMCELTYIVETMLGNTHVNGIINLDLRFSWL
jgi:hypothetical protein